MAYLKSQIEEKYQNDSIELVVHTASSFEHYYTYDGIDVCGTRVANEIEKEIDRLNETGQVVQLSVVGYSLGGLISRYALGLLYKRGLFESIQPTNFTTFASPHVGVLALGTGLASRLFNNVAPFLLAYTSRQLFLTDQLPFCNNRPVLECLADPTLPFYKALQCFKVRALYGNIVNDHRTAWYTSCVDVCDPYASNASRIRGPYAPGYGPVVIDQSKPLQLASNATDIPEVTDGLARRIVGRVYGWTAVIVNIGLVMPIWFCAFLVNTSYQNVSAALRKRSFTRSDLFSSFQLLDSNDESEPLMGSRFDEHPGLVLDSVFEAVNVNYNHMETPILPANTILEKASSRSGLDDSGDLASSSVVASEQDVEVLNLTQVQRRIVTNLNTLTWRKFPIHIQKSKHTHAAMICRFPAPNFDEGVVVVNHWVEQVFLKS